MLKTWRANRQPLDQAGQYTRNELSVRPLSIPAPPSPPLCWELTQQFPGIDVKQHNIIENNAEDGAVGHA